MKRLGILCAVAALAGWGTLNAADGESIAESSVATAVATAGDGNSIFVNRLFQDLYGRNAAGSELSGYVEDLKTGDITFPRVAAKLFEAPEFHDHAAFLVKLYIGLLNRDPDFNQWSQIFKVLRDGASEKDALSAFLTTPEFAAAFPPSLDNEAMIAKLFQQMFGRAPETAEMNRWVTELNQGIDRRDVVGELLRSPEFESFVSNRVNATLVYMVFLRRSANAGIIGPLAESLQSGVSLADVIASVLQSAEYGARS